MSYHFFKCGCSIIISHFPFLKISPINEMNQIVHQINLHDNQISAFLILCILYCVLLLRVMMSYLCIYAFHFFSYRCCNLCFALKNKEQTPAFLLINIHRNNLHANYSEESKTLFKENSCSIDLFCNNKSNRFFLIC